MIDLHTALRDCYLKPLKENPDLYLGVELEFPIVHQDGQATAVDVSKGLMRHLLDHGFELVRTDDQGHPVEVKEPETGDVILFEFSYNTVELAFAKAKTISQVEQRFEAYLELMQSFLAPHHHEIQGRGIHPHWHLNDNRPVALPRYQMLGAYLALGANEQSCHPFTDYGAFICGNQVQFDLSRTNYLRALNAFNQIEAAKAYLFPNSAFDGHNWQTAIARDRFWEESMHGLIQDNVGVYPKDFTSEADYLAFMAQSALFHVKRDGQIFYFSPKSLTTYLASPTIEALDLEGRVHHIRPQAGDLANHRSYHYQVLTKRGTLELRSVCTQPLEKTFAPIAFQLGLLVNLEALESYLAQAPFFVTYGRDYRKLRRQFAHLALSETKKEAVAQFARDLVQLAEEGLLHRGYGEETYLTPLKKQV